MLKKPSSITKKAKQNPDFLPKSHHFTPQYFTQTAKICFMAYQVTFKSYAEVANSYRTTTHKIHCSVMEPCSSERMFQAITV